MGALCDVMCGLFPPGLASVARILCYCFVTITIAGMIHVIVHAFNHLKGLFSLG